MRGVLHVGELASCFADFNHRQTVRRHFFVGLCGGAGHGGDARSVQKLVRQGFVVDRQEATLEAVGITRGARRVQAKVLHAVVVVAGAVLVIGVGAVIGKRGGRAGQRVAQGIQHAGGVTRRHSHLIQQVFVYRGEAEFEVHRRGNGRRRRWGRRSGCATTAGAQTKPGKYRAARRAHTCAQQAAPVEPRGDDAADAGVVAGVAVFAVVAVISGVAGCKRVVF